MSTFRYAILGAAKIATKFCQAASLVKDCQVCAVASKSLERAKVFAGKNGIPKAYGSYELKAKLGYEVSGTIYVMVVEGK